MSTVTFIDYYIPYLKGCLIRSQEINKHTEELEAQRKQCNNSLDKIAVDSRFEWPRENKVKDLV